MENTVEVARTMCTCENKNTNGQHTSTYSKNKKYKIALDSSS